MGDPGYTNLMGTPMAVEDHPSRNFPALSSQQLGIDKLKTTYKVLADTQMQGGAGLGKHISSQMNMAKSISDSIER